MMLDVDSLSISFLDGKETIRAVQDVSFSLEEKGSLSIIGESGSGKSVLAEAILGLIADDACIQGRIMYKGKDVLLMDEPSLQTLRGGDICLMPQNASQAWDPVIRVGAQMTEFLTECGMTGSEARDRMISLLPECGLDAEIMNQYPHRLSGGMSQRAMIAMCLAAEPSLLIADEPTKGLDNRCKRDVLELMGRHKDERAMLVITHDLSTARVCDRTAVLYGGYIVEMGETEEVLSDPIHPYSRGLVAAHPRNGMVPIPGGGERPPENGCCFQSRCCHDHDECGDHVHMHDMGGRYVRCCHDHR